MILDIISLLLMVAVAYLVWKGTKEIESLEARVFDLETICTHYVETFGQDALDEELNRLEKQKDPQG